MQPRETSSGPAPGKRPAYLTAERLFVWLLLAVLVGFAMMPAWLNPVEEHSYDAATFHVYRGVVFSDALAQGSIYPRWVQPINAGLGGPLFSFYPPLTYYLTAGLHAVGIPHPLAWRLLVGLAMAVAAAGVYALTMQFTGRALPALAAAVVFLFSLPFLRELLERGAPEGFAIALYPWVLWGLVRAIRQPSGARLAVAALLWAALILTHHLAAAFLLPVMLLIALLFMGRRPAASQASLALGFAEGEAKGEASRPGQQVSWRAPGLLGLVMLLGIALSAFFLVPFVLERGAVRLDNVIALDYAKAVQNAVPLRDLLALPPAYDVGLDNNAIGEHIGPLVALILACGLVAGSVLAAVRRSWSWLAAAGFSLLGLIVVWLQTPGATFLWEALPVLAYVQIRTRLLGVAVLCAAVAVGLVLGQVRARWQVGLAAGLVVVSMGLALPVLYPDLQYRYTAFEANPTAADAGAFALRENVPGLTAFNEFLPIWRYLPFTDEEAAAVASSVVGDLPAGARVLAQDRSGDRLAAQVESPGPLDVPMHQLYFPGWVATVNGERRDLVPSEGSGYGVVEGVPAGDETIELHYEATPAQRAGTWASALALAGLAMLAVSWRAVRRKAEDPIRAAYPKPRWWLIAGIAVVLAGKTLWLDPHTSLLRRTSTCSSVAGPAAPAAVRFGEQVRLCAVELPQRSVRPGDQLRVTLYWQAVGAGAQPALSFVHLLGTTFNPRTNNPLWGQQEKDAPGSHPLSRWTPGKVYRDDYELQVDPEAPAGEYELEIGWFDPATGARWTPAFDDSAGAQGMRISDLDSLLVPGITVR
jgi:hypothetical protein